MTLEAAILYAQQRMRELGKSTDQYHFAPVMVMGTPIEVLSGYFERSAYNELYILIKPENYYGLFILSDNSAFNSDDASQSGVLEFTGIIRFVKSAAVWSFAPFSDVGAIVKPIPVEFLRVVIY